jgi:hypothetical protein
MPDRQYELGAKVPDDHLDLILDLSGFPIDFLSWKNMGALNKANEMCTEASARISKVIDELVKIEALCRKTHEEEEAILAEIDRPYLLAAIQEVPQSIHFAIPKHLSANMETRRGPELA